MKKLFLSTLATMHDLLNWLVVQLLRTGWVKLYQPIYGEPDSERVTRDCYDRWQSISAHLTEKAGAVYDIGCNLGYFTFRATEKGYSGWGVDHDPLNVLYCRAIAGVRKKSDRTQFLLQNLDLAAIERLPHFDVVFNFSVFHHWVKAYGAETAQTMMKTLATKCDMMFFETGQPNEQGTKWAHKMEFMGTAPAEWIETFLLNECKFKTAKTVGTFATGLTNVERHLFMASKT